MNLTCGVVLIVFGLVTRVGQSTERERPGGPRASA
jgi:hypothetical protein